MNLRIAWPIALLLVVTPGTLVVGAEQRPETFDADPGWDCHNNRPPENSTRKVVQDFGYSADSHDGLGPGVIGGKISPDGAAAYYAKAIPSKTLNEAFSAAGTLFVNEGGGNTLLGFFNSHTLNEWRTPNSMVFRINGRGAFFHTHVEYATSKWRAGAGAIGRLDRQADRVYPVETPSKGLHRWTLSYDPNGNNGGGTITATFDDQQSICNLEPGHKLDGATFDRFGLLNVIKSADGPGELWVGALSIDGQPEKLDRDPGWIGFQNRRAYESEDVRPRFNFGYSRTHFAGGKSTGEMGGLFFRGDCRYPDRLAYYGARLAPLTLARPLHASGSLAFRRGVTDSTTLFGFFHGAESIHVNPSQKSGMPRNVVGIALEGPSSEGFALYPCFRTHGDIEGMAPSRSAPRIYPDGKAHHWSLDYDPAAAEGAGSITASLDGHAIVLNLPSGAKSPETEFNRFGLITPWIDGNGQMVYFDDIEYTCKQ